MAYGQIKREVLLAKIESTYGTDSSPAGTDAILVRNLTFNPERVRMVRRGAIRTSLGELQQIYGGSLVGMQFEVEMKGSGAAGTAPEVGALLRACGLSETIVASTSVTYAPSSSSLDSVTIYYWAAAAGSTTQVRHILLGCRGNVEFVYAAGDILLARFTFIGKRQGNPTDQTLATPTYDSVVPVAVRGMATTIGGVSNLVISGYRLQTNSELVVPDNVNDTEGYGNVVVASRDVTLEVTRQSELVATLAPFADMVSGTARAFASGTLGATAGNRIALSCPQMHYRGIAYGESEQIRVETATFGCHESVSGNDEFSLAFT